MKQSVEQRVESMVRPLVAQARLDIYDVEFTSGVLRVTLDRKGGIDVDTIGEFSKSISRLLDEDESIVPGDNYMLEVTSPGIERKLRKPAHFVAMVGQRAKLKLTHGSGAARRIEGVISAADEESIDLAIDDAEPRKIAYDEIESARSVFDFTAALADANTRSVPDTADPSANEDSVEDDPINDDEEKATAR